MISTFKQSNNSAAATPKKGMNSELTSVIGQRESTQEFDKDDDGQGSVKSTKQ